MAFNRGRPATSSHLHPAPEASAPSFIDASCELSGSLRFRESVRIDGRVEGDIQGEKTVTVGESGVIQASIKCESVVIHGQVDGDIDARRNITFHKGARVNGEMRAAGIVVEEGAKFRGCIIIGEDEPAPVAAPAKPAAADAAKPAAGDAAKKTA